MSRAKNIQKYPDSYFQLFRLASRKEITIDYDSPEAALSARNDLYTFRQVLFKQEEKFYQKQSTYAANVKLSVKTNTLTAKPIRKLENEENTN